MLNMATLKGVKKPAVVERRDLKTGIMVHIFRRTIVEDIHSVAHRKKPERVQILAHPHMWSGCECWIIDFGKLQKLLVKCSYSMTELFAARAVLINAHVLELPWKRLFSQNSCRWLTGCSHPNWLVMCLKVSFWSFHGHILEMSSQYALFQTLHHCSCMLAMDYTV